MPRQHPQLRVGQQVERLLGGLRAGGGGPRRPTAAARACRAAGRGRAARGARRAASARAKRAHERARFALPPTSANAWRTRSRAAGSRARAERARRARAGSAARAPWHQRAVEARHAADARAARQRRHVAASLGGRCRRLGISTSRAGRSGAELERAQQDLARRAPWPPTSGRGPRDLDAEAGDDLGQPVERVGVARAVLGVAVQRQVGEHDAVAVREALDERLNSRWLSSAECQGQPPGRCPSRGRRRARRRGGGRGAASWRDRDLA